MLNLVKNDRISSKKIFFTRFEKVMAAVDNVKNEPYTVESGQRLFQLVAMDGSPIHIELVSKLTETGRGEGGFGSTGK